VGKLKIQLHSFQEKAFLSKKQIVINAAGIQSGKTSLGAIWTHKRSAEIEPTDNLIIVAPTYKILQQATLPKFLQFAGKMGTYNKVDSFFKYHHGPTVYIRSLTDPNSIEGITDVEGVWLDEGGLISRYAWENVTGRAAFRQATVMVTTTPYSMNWMYQLWKEWKAEKRDDVDFFSYKSIDNPHFPKAEYDRQKRILDPVRFAMKYMGVFGKMEGLVFPEVVFLKSFVLPLGTRYYAGVDWGFRNPFALTIRALTPDGIHYRAAEFCKSGLTIDECVQVARARQQIYNIELFVCDPSNPAAIENFNRAGLKAMGGENDVVEGIDRHRTLIKDQKFFVFEHENPHGYDEYNSYHYAEPQDLKRDQDAKEQVPVAQNDHSIDADRYLTMYLTDAQVSNKRIPVLPENDRQIPEDSLKRLEWLKKGGSSRYKIRG